MVVGSFFFDIFRNKLRFDFLFSVVFGRLFGVGLFFGFFFGILCFILLRFEFKLSLGVYYCIRSLFFCIYLFEIVCFL